MAFCFSYEEVQHRFIQDATIENSITNSTIELWYYGTILSWNASHVLLSTLAPYAGGDNERQVLYEDIRHVDTKKECLPTIQPGYFRSFVYIATVLLALLFLYHPKYRNRSTA